ncbi:hypothetical protein Tsubulata_031551 [Turnera subulata]|uniref:Zinc knuckle CX2CX4HX4C domain-containing protein n=1 Tax=Turnera subulata TaxID=218843 RepID=A0A9Q0FL10_9ROSI|nr:hypothetical protein Tsubulata_031551 [Turnera subulata]
MTQPHRVGDAVKCFSGLIEIESSIENFLLCRGFFRVNVHFDLNGPLVAGTVVRDRLGLATWLSYTYERLKSFHYRCGKLDHTVEQCLAKPRRDEGQRTRSRSSFGPWLRVHGPLAEDESSIASLVAANLQNGWVKSLALVAKEIPTSTPLTDAAKSASLKKLVRLTKMVYHPVLEDIEEKKLFNNWGLDYLDNVLDDHPSTSKP